DGLQRGLSWPGRGHAARLQLVAQSIPAQVWLTEVKANEFQLDVSGFTLEPSALNDWVLKLAASPLLKGQKLSTVKVENASVALIKTVSGAAVSALPAASSTVAATPRPMWSFNLVSELGKPSASTGVNP
ncbi:MAG: PilN domain-containing protein, partial [Rhodoferax sp.]